MARKQDKPDIPPGTPFQRVRPMLITFLVVAVLGPMLFSSYWLNTFSTVACLVLASATVTAPARQTITSQSARRVAMSSMKGTSSACTPACA